MAKGLSLVEINAGVSFFAPFRGRLYLGRLATASLNDNGCVTKGSARVWTSSPETPLRFSRVIVGRLQSYRYSSPETTEKAFCNLPESGGCPARCNASQNLCGSERSRTEAQPPGLYRGTQKGGELNRDEVTSAAVRRGSRVGKFGDRGWGKSAILVSRTPPAKAARERKLA